jgi:hypothetical protein
MADRNELEEFRRFRERVSERMLEAGNPGIERFFAPDTPNARGTPGPFAGSAG